MNYIKKIFKNDKDEYISFPSTDDNITCENGVNGSTTVSKTVCLGSSPSSHAN